MHVRKSLVECNCSPVFVLAAAVWLLQLVDVVVAIARPVTETWCGSGPSVRVAQLRVVAAVGSVADVTRCVRGSDAWPAKKIKVSIQCSYIIEDWSKNIFGGDARVQEEEKLTHLQCAYMTTHTVTHTGSETKIWPNMGQNGGYVRSKSLCP
jgi:hypothetical protein